MHRLPIMTVPESVPWQPHPSSANAAMMHMQSQLTAEEHLHRKAVCCQLEDRLVEVPAGRLVVAAPDVTVDK